MAKPKFQRGSARMFRSDFVERFSRVHPATPAVLFLPVFALALFWSVAREGTPPARALALVVLGYLIWTLFEYWFHRLFFHLRVRGPRTDRVYFLVHGVHHDYPWDASRLVMPPAVSIALGVLAFGLFRLTLGADRMHAPFAGFVLGYVIYDSVHWYVHAAKPTTRFGKWLRREHLVHHFKESTSRFGVSCPWWDHVFGTTGQPAEMPGGAAEEAAR